MYYEDHHYIFPHPVQLWGSRSYPSRFCIVRTDLLPFRNFSLKVRERTCGDSSIWRRILCTLCF